MAPHRYLVAHIGAARPDREALLRFPPGATLEDAQCDAWCTGYKFEYPTLPLDAVGRLRDLGVEIVAIGPDASGEALKSVAAPRSSLDAFVEDYLDVNARLGGERCVTVEDYAMHTHVGCSMLRAAMYNLLLFERDDARVYAGAAFRKDSLPDLLRLRVWKIADELRLPTRVFVPCRLHGDRCDNYGRYGRYRAFPGSTISSSVDPGHFGARVPVPRRILDDLHDGSDDLRVARAVRDIARIALDALPDDAWEDRAPGCDFRKLVASARAETCEEYATLVNALQGCASAREVVRRASDASWVVSRTLENPRDRR